MPSAAGRSDLKVLVAAGVAMAALTLAGVWLSPPSPSYARASTYSAGPTGAKAAFLTLRQLGYDVERSFEPVGTLRLDPETTTLVLASPRAMPSTQDRRALQRFLEAGGVALATGSGLAFLPGAPAATRLDDGVIGRRRRFRALAPGPLTRETHGIEIEAEMNDPSERSPYVPVFADGETAGVLVARVGEGRAIWWTGSTPLLNTGIEETGHFELLLNALGPPGKRRILWDEHYHGHARSFWSYVAATPLPFALAQLGLLAVAALATYSRRRGPIQPVAVDTRASALEFVEAMASLYQRAGATAAAVDVARTRFRRLLGATAQVPSNAPDARLVKLTAARSGLDPNTVSALLSDASRATHTSLPATDALALVQRLQDASASVRHRPQTDTDRNRQTQTKAGHRLHRQTQTDTDEGGAQTT